MEMFLTGKPIWTWESKVYYDEILSKMIFIPFKLKAYEIIRLKATTASLTLNKICLE
jgi:hypothetical protein